MQGRRGAQVNFARGTKQKQKRLLPRLAKRPLGFYGNRDAARPKRERGKGWPEGVVSATLRGPLAPPIGFPFRVLCYVPPSSCSTAAAGHSGEDRGLSLRRLNLSLLSVPVQMEAFQEAPGWVLSPGANGVSMAMSSLHRIALWAGSLWSPIAET